MYVQTLKLLFTHFNTCLQTIKVLITHYVAAKLFIILEGLLIDQVSSFTNIFSIFQSKFMHKFLKILRI